VSASGYPTIPVLNTTSPEMDVSAPKEWPVMGADPSLRYSTALSPCGWRVYGCMDACVCLCGCLFMFHEDNDM
jgi:hypothetical protein